MMDEKQKQQVIIVDHDYSHAFIWVKPGFI
jgi:hypothetical protein